MDGAPAGGFPVQLEAGGGGVVGRREDRFSFRYCGRRKEKERLF